MYTREGCCKILIYRKLEKVKFLKNAHIKPKNRTNKSHLGQEKVFTKSRARGYIAYDDKKRT